MKNIVNPYADLLGVFETNVGNGAASVMVKTKRQHTNHLGYIHGGLLYSLADIAFELASNSHELDAVGITTNLQMHKPAKVGETIEAVAKEIHLGRKIASYQVEVTSNKILLATFIGTVYRFAE